MRGILRPEDRLHDAVRRAQVAAALVRRILARVRDELVPMRPRDPHEVKASLRPDGALHHASRGARWRRRGARFWRPAAAAIPPPGGGAEARIRRGPARLAARAGARRGGGVGVPCEEVLRGDALRTARAIAEQERAHVARLQGLIRDLGGDPPAGRSAEEYARTFPRLRDGDDALRFAEDLEERQVRAYLEALTELPDLDLRTVAAQIGADEGAHLGAVRVLQGLPAAQGPFVTGRSDGRPLGCRAARGPARARAPAACPRTRRRCAAT